MLMLVFLSFLRRALVPRVVDHLSPHPFFSNSGSLLAWFRSYLSGRRHRVVIGNKSSDYLPFTFGIPQGSILGPLLFLLLINDEPNAISKETSLPLFADDSKCFRLILGRDDGDKLQDDLNKLWSLMPRSVRFKGWLV